MSNKIGVSLKIDVNKLDKSRFFQGKNGTYADLTVFIDPDNPGQYGDHGAITQSKAKDENVQMPILGNAKVFWREGGQQQPAQQAPQQNFQQGQAKYAQQANNPVQQGPNYDPNVDFSDDLPF